jgi:hypothetical protein
VSKHDFKFNGKVRISMERNGATEKNGRREIVAECCNGKEIVRERSYILIFKHGNVTNFTFNCLYFFWNICN